MSFPQLPSTASFFSTPHTYHHPRSNVSRPSSKTGLVRGVLRRKNRRVASWRGGGQRHVCTTLVASSHASRPPSTPSLNQPCRMCRSVPFGLLSTKKKKQRRKNETRTQRMDPAAACGTYCNHANCVTHAANLHACCIPASDSACLARGVYSKRQEKMTGSGARTS